MKNIFNQIICNKDCPAWVEEHGICDIGMDYLGRVGVVDGTIVVGTLCRISDMYKLVPIGD